MYSVGHAYALSIAPALPFPPASRRAHSQPGEAARASLTARLAAPLAAPRERAALLVSWNRLRILACIDVVSFHLTGEHALAAIGLPISLAVSFALSARHATQPPLQKFLTVRIRRLMLPWVFWSAALGALLLLASWRAHEPLWSRFEPAMLLYGTAAGLWFLPAMTLGGVLAYFADRYTRQVPIGAHAAACSGLALLGLLPQLQPSSELIYPLPQWRFALSALPIGLLLGRLLTHGSRLVWALLALTTAGAALILIALSDAPHATEQVAVRYAATVALLAAGAAFPGKPDAWTARIEPLLLGIYALHFPVHEYVVRAGLARLGWQAQPALRIAATLLFTGLLVAVLRKTPLRKVV